MLDPKYFPILGQMSRHPRYVNQRKMDPHIKCCVDENGIEIPPEWGLPAPNPQAAYKSIAKYAKNVPWMSEKQVDAMNLAWEFTERQFGPYMRNSRVLTYEEAKTHFDMSTSCGAPFNVHHSKKKDLFAEDEEIDQWLEEDWETLADDPKWTCLFTNSLKEEIRAKEKIEKNSIRTFLSAGIDAVAHGTRLFVDMNQKMNDSHLQTASAVGMSPYNGNWDRMMRKLLAFERGFALDESEYDSSLREYMMWGCALFRWNQLRKEDQTDRNLNRLLTYYRNLIYSVIIGPDGVLFLKLGGNPSGSVNTINDNTLILFTLMSYAWIMNAEPGYNTYEEFEQNTAKALVGDDNTWSVAEEVIHFYNARNVAKTWTAIGVTTTTDSWEPRPVLDLDFLSAHSVMLGGKIVPKYNRVKLMNSLLYAPRAHHTPATTLERTAAMLAVGWTDLPFRDFCRDLIDWLIEHYDKVMAEDPHWISAKCQVLPDSRYYALFTGRKSLALRPQSLSGELVKLTQPDKKEMSNSNKKGNQKKKPTPRRRNGQKPTKRAQTKNSRPRRQRRNVQLTAKGNPRTGMRSRKTCTVVEDEYLGSVNGSVGFVNTVYPINPGQAKTFPWLSLQAKQWEKYHFNHLEFYYKRTVSEYADNGKTGKVIFSVDFDASDAAPGTKQQMEDTDPHVDAMPSENFRMPLRSNQLHSLCKELYVRPGGLPGSSDIKTYDAGNLNVATQGCFDASEVGELRVRYSVTFSVPVLENQLGIPTNNSVTYGFSYTRDLVSTVEQDLTPQTFNANGLQAIVSGNGLVLPAGKYLVSAIAQFNGAVNTVITNANLVVQKNGTPAYVGANFNSTAGVNDVQVVGPSFMYLSDGDDVLTFEAKATFSVSTATCTATYYIQAI